MSCVYDGVHGMIYQFYLWYLLLANCMAWFILTIRFRDVIGLIFKCQGQNCFVLKVNDKKNIFVKCKEWNRYFTQNFYIFCEYIFFIIFFILHISIYYNIFFIRILKNSNRNRTVTTKLKLAKHCAIRAYIVREFWSAW